MPQLSGGVKGISASSSSDTRPAESTSTYMTNFMIENPNGRTIVRLFRRPQPVSVQQRERGENERIRNRLRVRENPHEREHPEAKSNQN